MIVLCVLLGWRCVAVSNMNRCVVLIEVVVIPRWIRKDRAIARAAS